MKCDWLEQPVFVADAIAVGRHAQGRERLQKTRRQPAQPAIAECGVGFVPDYLRRVAAQLRQRLVRASRSRRLISPSSRSRPIRNSIDR
jgi:hypothetical protein